MVHAHLEHPTSVSAGAESTVSGMPIRLLKLPLVAPDTIALGEHGGESTSLVVVLPMETGNTNDQAAKLRAIRVRQTQQKLLGIIGQQDGAPLSCASETSSASGSRVITTAPGTRLDGTGSKIIAVDVFTGKGDENRPFLDLARVDNAPAAYPIGFSRHGSGPCCGARLLTAISIIAAPL